MMSYMCIYDDCSIEMLYGIPFNVYLGMFVVYHKMLYVVSFVIYGTYWHPLLLLTEFLLNISV